jgi:hypothetical protein
MGSPQSVRSILRKKFENVMIQIESAGTGAGPEHWTKGYARGKCELSQYFDAKSESARRIYSFIGERVSSRHHHDIRVLL